MKTILVVDDEPNIVEIARDYLVQAGFQVTAAPDGAAALESARAVPPDLVVLDLGLPVIDGLEVARRLRQERDVPIVILTARDQEVDRIVGLELGADDYVTKPFSPRELVARVRAVLRRGERAEQATPGERVEAGDVALDLSRMRATVGGRAIDLTATEFQLLAALVAQPGRVFSRDQLMTAAWEDPGASLDRTVDAHIKTLRAKLRAAAPEEDPIQTHRGLGYSLRVAG